MEQSNNKKTALTYIFFAVITYIILYLSRLTSLLEPILFSKIMGEKYARIFSAIFLFVFLSVTLLAFIFISKKLGLINIFKLTKERISLKNSLIIFALVFVSIFAVGASLGFDVRIIVDLGACATQTEQKTVVAFYLVNLLELFISFSSAIYLGLGLEMFLPKTKFSIPYVAIALLVFYGVFCFFTMDAYLPTRLLFLAISFIYGLIYYLSKKSLCTAYMLSVIIFLL